MAANSRLEGTLMERGADLAAPRAPNKTDARYRVKAERGCGQAAAARLLVVLAVASACGLASLRCSHRGTDAPTGDFVITDLGVSFASWERGTNRAGDFVFVPSERKLFLEFGGVVSTGDGGTKELPTFEYRVAPDAVVRAVADGVVTRAVFQDDTRDYELVVRSNQDASFEVCYDHVLHPSVALGDVVRAKDALGNPGTWSSQLGRFEVMVNNTRTGLSYCPFACFDPALREQYQQAVASFIADWEAFKGDPGIYDEEGFVCPGCRYQTMVTY